jgi:hypothetical protein
MPQIYQVKLERDWGAWQLVALFNWRELPADCSLSFAELGYQAGAALNVYELWTKHFWHSTDPTLVLPNVPAHGCRLVRVSEVGTVPQLVGDTLHISQGAEIASMKMEGDRLVVDTMDLGRNVESELWLSLPNQPGKAICNQQEISVELKGEGIYAFPMQFRGVGRFEIIF